jgi:hypothetical protein
MLQYTIEIMLYLSLKYSGTSETIYQWPIFLVTIKIIVIIYLYFLKIHWHYATMILYGKEIFTKFVIIKFLKKNSFWYFIIVAHGAYEYISLCHKLIAMYICANGGLWYAPEQKAWWIFFSRTLLLSTIWISVQNTYMVIWL